MAKRQINKFEISGKVIFVGMPTYYTEKYSNRSLILKVWADEKYAKEAEIIFVNDRMSKLDNIRPGDWVNVDFQLTGQKKLQGDGKARWYTSVEGLNCIVES